MGATLKRSQAELRSSGASRLIMSFVTFGRRARNSGKMCFIFIYNPLPNNPYRMGEVELQNDLAFYREFFLESNVNLPETDPL